MKDVPNSAFNRSATSWGRVRPSSAIPAWPATNRAALVASWWSRCPVTPSGCSCAGPDSHRLLAIETATSHALLDEVVHGCDGIKPGWTRINFNYFISDTVRDYLIAAVDLIATHGHRLLPDFRFDPHTGQWRHHAGATDPRCA